MLIARSCLDNIMQIVSGHDYAFNIVIVNFFQSFFIVITTAYKDKETGYFVWSVNFSYTTMWKLRLIIINSYSLTKLQNPRLKRKLHVTFV